jgi:hypothetical protein
VAALALGARRMITIETAWAAIDAADQLGRLHGFELKPSVTPKRLFLTFMRGGRMCGLAFEAGTLAPLDLAGVRELVERQAAELFREWSKAFEPRSVS